MGKWKMVYASSLIAVFVLSIVSVILFAVAVSVQEDFPYITLVNLANNWMKKPTSTITLSICDMKIVSNVYAGTYPGCYCFGKLSIGKCTNTDTSNKCYNVARKDPLQLPKWKGNLELCADGTSKYGTYLDLNIVPRSESCPEAFPKKCGIIDDEGNSLCLRSTEICPINDVKITSSSSSPTPSGYLSLVLQDSSKLLYTNSKITDGTVFIETKFSEDTPCLDVSNMNNPSAKVYPLDLEASKTCSVKNEAYKVLDKDSCDNVLNVNNFNNLANPDYPRCDFNVNLYWKGYIGVKKVCIKYLKNEALLLRGSKSARNNISSGSNSVYNEFYKTLLFSNNRIEAENTSNNNYNGSLLYSNLVNYLLNFIIMAIVLANFLVKIVKWDKKYTYVCICCDEDDYAISKFEVEVEGAGCGGCCLSFLLHMVDYVSLCLVSVTLGFTSAYADNVFYLDRHLAALQNCLDEYNGPIIDKLASDYISAKSLAVAASSVNGLNVFLLFFAYISWNNYQYEFLKENEDQNFKDDDPAEPSTHQVAVQVATNVIVESQPNVQPVVETGTNLVLVPHVGLQSSEHPDPEINLPQIEIELREINP